MLKFIVTTARKPNLETETLAANFAEKLNLKFVPRKDFSLETLKQMHGAENILLIKNNFPVILTNEGELFFHPNTAHLRIKNLRQGEGDSKVAIKFWIVLWGSAVIQSLKVVLSETRAKLRRWKLIPCLPKLSATV